MIIMQSNELFKIIVGKEIGDVIGRDIVPNVPEVTIDRDKMPKVYQAVCEMSDFYNSCGLEHLAEYFGKSFRLIEGAHKFGNVEQFNAGVRSLLLDILYK
jgi:hypothetical protein